MRGFVYNRLPWSSDNIQLLGRRRAQVLIDFHYANFRCKSTAPSDIRRLGQGASSGAQHKIQEINGRDLSGQAVKVAPLTRGLVPVEKHYIDGDLYKTPYVEQKGGDFDRDLSSTRPAPLQQPEPLSVRDGEESIALADRAKHLYQIGRGYLSFYKTGLKNIWSNYKEYREITERLGNVKLEDAAKYGGQGGLPSVTRREYQVCVRTRNDLFKLIPFGLIFAICGEFTPLVIVAVGSGVVPKTCHIPKQVQQDNLKYVRRKARADFETAKYEQWLRVSEANVVDKDVRQELLAAYRYGPATTPRPFPILGSLVYRFWTKQRIQKWADNVLNDTVLIRREGGFSRLDPAERYEWAFKYQSPALQQVQQEIYAKHNEKDATVPMPVIQKLTRAFEDEASFILSHKFSRLPDKDRYLAVLARPDPTKMPGGYLKTIETALASI